MSFDCQFTLALGQRILQADIRTQARAVGIFGASGTGKTSILHAMAGLYRPQQGRIVVNGDCWFDSTHNICSKPQQRRTGLVFQDAQLFPHKTVWQNLLFGYHNISAHDRRFEPDEIIALLKLSSLLDRMPLKLSGGEKQRVALGRALLYSPKLLLLDEPLSALDCAHKAEILPFFLHIKQHYHIPMLYVSHDKTEVAQISDTIVYL